MLVLNDCKRMVELLWFVGYCEEFPVQLADRIGGHPDWNRHVKYEAVRKGLVSVYRAERRQRIVRSLRLTPAGLDYISDRDDNALRYILAKTAASNNTHPNIERVLRLHALATALVMARNAGAEILPDKKPSLLIKSSAVKVPYQPERTYFYSTQELRQSIQELEPDSCAKTSRILGVILRGHRCFCLYYTGNARMYWRSGNEENSVASIQVTLNRHGINCSVFSQIVIGSNMRVAAKLVKYDPNKRSRYFSLSDYFDSCHFITNDQRGDKLLREIVNPQVSLQIGQKALRDYKPPESPTRLYDALAQDGTQPVVLGFPCDLSQLCELRSLLPGFKEKTLVLCYDYQLDTIANIVKPGAVVRAMEGCD